VKENLIIRNIIKNTIFMEINIVIICTSKSFVVCKLKTGIKENEKYE
jgi:hypothetical protein